MVSVLCPEIIPLFFEGRIHFPCFNSEYIGIIMIIELMMKVMTRS